MVSTTIESPNTAGALEAPAPCRTVITTLEQLERELPSWLGQDFAVDLETTGLDYTKDRILGIALTFADSRSYYIVCEHTVLLEYGYENFKPGNKIFCWRVDVMRLLKPLFSQPDVVMIAHNAKFELHFLTRAGIALQGHLVDTMLAAQLIDENRKVGLKSLCGLVGMHLDDYKDLEHYPGFAKEDILGVPLHRVAQYAMDDTEATWKLWQRFEPELEREGVKDAFSTIWMPLLPVLRDMEARGIALDMGKVAEAHAHFKQMADKAYWEVWREGVRMVKDQWERVGWSNLSPCYLMPLSKIPVPYTLDPGTPGKWLYVQGEELPIFRKYNQDGEPSKAYEPRVPWFNPGSSDQLRALLFDWHKLKLPTDIQLNLTTKGVVGLDKDTLKVLLYDLGEQAPAVLKSILSYRKASKMLSTYLDVYKEKADVSDHFALRTNFNQASTDTGRLSSSGPNLQNQPARGDDGSRIRGLFVARPGYSLVVADYNSMELRVAANYSKDPVMRQAFVDGFDLHSMTAANQMGVEYADFVERLAGGDALCRTARLIGKTSNFGLLYGMGARKFQRLLLVDTGVKVTLEEAYALVDGFNETYAALTDWKRRVERVATNRGYVLTIGGRKRRLPDLNSHDSYLQSVARRQAVNAIIQGSCADIISEAIPPLQRHLRELGGSLLLQVHDELVAEVPEADASVCAEAMKYFMTNRANERFEIPLTVEAGIGASWGSAK